MTASSPPPGARIVGVGHFQPPRVVSNDEIARMVDTNDEWIRQRVGIVSRRFADTESVADMASEAARAALADARVHAEEVDLVIVATCSNVNRSPSTAGRVIESLGLTDAAGFDVNAACSGFVHALETARQLLAGGATRTAIVVGAERMTDVTDFTDRSTCILVGDGAGAVVLRASAHDTFGPIVWGTVPGLADAARIEAPEGTFAQEGRKVFRWAITEAAPHARKALEAANLRPDQLAAFIPHQANLRIVEHLADQLQLTDAVIATDVQESGNTSAASIPLALSKLLHQHSIPPGAPLLLFGFGGGFSYAGLVVAAPQHPSEEGSS
ncbi:beta-ketoacyl-ACP synthase 3 [Streptomyces smyrnaeus]|uniref:beta-ketoacyl-ACP synthase 3 n=1 Tax=Streptomyces smyrnaeus TaxID=1387713 RepID=UPI0033BA4CC7